MGMEGCIRNLGQHACATIISSGNLMDFIPICLSRDPDSGKEYWTSQFDGHFIEEVGMLKMDFLGLNTLSIIHETLNNIRRNHGREIDIEKIPLDDKETYKLYSAGDTMEVFQFESEGMKKHLRSLQPTRFEDLIAMNALYRPGPMDYIPSFVDRKQGRERIRYDLPAMEGILKETYGITVYQEQVMQLSQLLAGFTKGEADTLRKAMGKKKRDILDELKPKFIDGGTQRGHDGKILSKIWKDWEKFAEYAFNKSHATCYAWVSYQTAWLKAHYLPEFLAANLSCNLGKADEIKKIMADCRLHKIPVLSPDVNESADNFAVTPRGDIRFGLKGIKGFGGTVSDALLAERAKNGPFKDLFDFVERMSGWVNRRSLETLVYAGAFDSFKVDRRLFFAQDKDGNFFIDTLADYADRFKRDSLNAGDSLFGDVVELKPQRPELPEVTFEEGYDLHFLHEENERVGMYLSEHPLDRFSFEIDNFVNLTSDKITEAQEEALALKKERQVTLAGIVVSSEKKEEPGRKPRLEVGFEDLSGPFSQTFYGEDCDRFIGLLQKGSYVFLKGNIQPRFVWDKNKDDKRGRDGEKKPPQVAEYVLRIKEVQSLGNLSAKSVRSVELHTLLEQTDAKAGKALMALLRKYKGNTAVDVVVHSPGQSYQAAFTMKQHVAVNAEFIRTMEEAGYRVMVNFAG